MTTANAKGLPFDDLLWEKSVLKDFIANAKSGNVDEFHLVCRRAEFLWRQIFLRVRRLNPDHVHPRIKAFFVECYKDTASAIFGDEIDRGLLIDGLRVMFPRYTGPARRLYRGEHPLLAKRGNYGVSWTTSKATAMQFPLMSPGESTGNVLLKTIAPRSAIVCHIGGNEREYIVDPRKLKRIEVIAQELI